MHIRFESPVDIEKLVAELLQQKLIELTTDTQQRALFAEALTKQLLIADDGHTYPLYRIKNLTDVEATAFSPLRFSTHGGKKFTLAEVRKADDQQLKSFIHNKPLAEMICSANPRMHFFGMTIPDSAIAPFFLLYPVTVPTEHAIEYSVIHKSILKFRKNPLTNTKLSVEQLLPNIALTDLLLLNYNYFLELKSKVANRKIDSSKLQKLDDIIKHLEESLEIQKTAFPGIKCKALIAQKPVLGSKEEYLLLETKIKENDRKYIYDVILRPLILASLLVTAVVLFVYHYMAKIAPTLFTPIVRAGTDIFGDLFQLFFMLAGGLGGVYVMKLITKYILEPMAHYAVQPLLDTMNEGARLESLQSEFRTTHFYCMNREFLDATFEKVQTLEKKLVAIKNPEPKDKAVAPEKTNASQLLPPTASLLRHASTSPVPIRLIPSPSIQRDEDFQPKPGNP